MARHGTVWTDEELATLRRMAEVGASIGDIAKTLQRTREAVTSKAALLKVRLHS